MPFRRIVCIALLTAAWVVRAADTPDVTDGEAWNEGVGYYRAGDVTNALRVLRPLMLSRTHGARAAEVVAKLAYDRKDLEEAAAAAQIALRSAPDDPKANRNFTRAADRLPEEREKKRVEAILKAAQGQDPGAMLGAAAHEARALLALAPTIATNAPARAVALADATGARAKRLADTWLPVREVVAQSVTNEEQAATIISQLEQAEARTKKAAEALADLDDAAYELLSGVEHDLTRFYKMTAMPPAALAEDIVAQSNAWQDAEVVNGRPWQGDALDFTRAFRAKFPAWAGAYEQKAQSDTNMPPFTAEDQQKISALATELEKAQLACAEQPLPIEQEKALRILQDIQKLMPKDKNGGGGQNAQNQQQNQDKNQQQDQQQNQDKQNQDQQQNDSSDERQQDDPEQQQEQESEAQESEEKPEDKEVEALLKKAQERNDEHEAEKKARMRKAPLPPNERDW